MMMNYDETMITNIFMHMTKSDKHEYERTEDNCENDENEIN